MNSFVVSPFNVSYANDTIAYTYDRLGRPSAVTMAGGNEAFAYDILGRLNSHTTGLGVFSYGYLGNTGQVSSRGLSGTGISTAWGYDSNANDRRLTTITNSGVSRSYALGYLVPGGTINPYDIQSIADNTSATHPWLSQTHGYNYDQADRLLSATQATPGTNTYVYDKLDNATTVTNPGTPTVNSTYNANNQLATLSGSLLSVESGGPSNCGARQCINGID